MIPEPMPLPLPSLRTLGLIGLATAGVWAVRWWLRREQGQPAGAAAPRRTVARVIEARPVIHRGVSDRRAAAADLPWVDVP